MLQKGKEAADKVNAQFSSVTLLQLNWKPAPGTRSIGQCLDHLVVSDCLYFAALKRITERKNKMTAWEKFSRLPAFLEKYL